MPTEIIVFLFLVVVAVSFAIYVIFRASGKNTSKFNDNAEDIYNTTIVPRKTSRNDMAISEIESLILKDSNGCELVLTRPNTIQLSEKNYREIYVRGTSSIGQVVQGAIPILAHTKTLSEIAKVAPNGLFTATASIQDLMKYSNGTIGSIVMNNGKIANHAGFAQVAMKAVNPVAVLGASMQAMALISGQYYMNEISKQLENIDRKLDKLIGFHHDEKIGILRNINRELSELTLKTNVDAADIIACQRLEEKCGEIYFEYYTRLEGANVNAKERWLNKSKELKELGTSINENELDFSIQMCYQASMLREKCKLAEIAIRLKMGIGQERFIAEQSANLQKMSSTAFHNNIHKQIDEHYSPVLEKVEKIVKKRKLQFLFGFTLDKAKNIKMKKEAIYEILQECENGENLAQKMLQSLNKPQETLILLGETPDTQRVFVLEDEDSVYG